MFYLILIDGTLLPFKNENECKSEMFNYKDVVFCGVEDIGNGFVGREWRFNISRTALHPVRRSFRRLKYYQVALKGVKYYETSYEKKKGS